MPLALVDRQWLLAGGRWGESAFDWGWDGLELAIGRREAQLPQEDLEALVRQRVEWARQGGWNLAAVSCRFLYLTPTSPPAELTDRVGEIITWAARFGVGVVHIPCGGPDGLSDLASWRQRWIDRAEQCGVRLAFECWDQPERFLEYSLRPAVGVAYDLGNRLALGREPLRELPQWGDRLVQLRLKDRVRGRPEQLRPLGEGSLRLPLLARIVQTVRFQGWLVLDQPAVACDKSALKELSQRLRTALNSTATVTSSLAA